MELEIGEEYKRKELHNYFGGQRQGGISTPRNHPIIFIFSNKRGKDYGYENEWCDTIFHLVPDFSKTNVNRAETVLSFSPSYNSKS